MVPTRRQALVAGAAMLGAAAVGAALRPREVLAVGEQLDLHAAIPSQLGTWMEDTASSAFIRPADDETRRIYQQLLERVYVNAQGQRVMLSLAYGRSQVTDLELHWPEVCYRYAGFDVTSPQPVVMSAGAGGLPATRMVASLPGRPEPITYWAVLGGRRAGNATDFRLMKIEAAMRREVHDGLLVRVSSIDPKSDQAFALHETFVAALLQAVPPEIRARIAGSGPQA